MSPYLNLLFLGCANFHPRGDGQVFELEKRHPGEASRVVLGDQVGQDPPGCALDPWGVLHGEHRHSGALTRVT